MTIICAWCKDELATTEGKGVSHGICPTCFQQMVEDVPPDILSRAAIVQEEILETRYTIITEAAR